MSPAPLHSAAERYRLRLTRKRLLWRAFRKRRELRAVRIEAKAIAAAPFLLFATMRDEALRLPHFLDHYRRLGVGHFLIVDNGSTDGTAALLAAEPDVSLWSTGESYRAARFGMAWLGWLQRRYGAGKWILTVDADELLIYPGWDRRGLGELTAWLDARGRPALGALMLDLYPKGSPDAQSHATGEDPTATLTHFDPWGYWCERRGRHRAVNLCGGVRARSFFADAPGAAPVLSKVPLVRWRRAYAYLSSTHVLLPVALNRCLEAGGPGDPSGILLHSKFLPGVAARARAEEARGEQYVKSRAHAAYYDRLAGAPDLWSEGSARYEDWRQLVDLGLMRQGEW